MLTQKNTKTKQLSATKKREVKQKSKGQIKEENTGGSLLDPLSSFDKSRSKSSNPAKTSSTWSDDKTEKRQMMEQMKALITSPQDLNSGEHQITHITLFDVFEIIHGKIQSSSQDQNMEVKDREVLELLVNLMRPID